MASVTDSDGDATPDPREVVGSLCKHRQKGAQGGGCGLIDQQQRGGTGAYNGEGGEQEANAGSGRRGVALPAAPHPDPDSVVFAA